MKYAVLSGNRVFYVHQLHQKYGRIVHVTPEEVSVTDSEAFKTIYRVSPGLEKSHWYGKFASFTRRMMFTMTDSKSHAARRKQLARPFGKSQIREQWEDRVREKIEFAIDRVSQEGEGGDVDILKWWTLLFTDVITMLVFGEADGLLQIGRVSEELIY